MTASQTLFLTAALLTSTISAQNLRLPPAQAQYHHEIIYSDDGFSGESFTSPEILPLSTSSEIPIDIGFQQAGNPFHTPTEPAVNLFTPNTVQQPAETPGQLENYRKALEEEAREAERAENAITTVFRDQIGGLRAGRAGRPKSYVSVQVGDGAKRYDYGYMV